MSSWIRAFLSEEWFEQHSEGAVDEDLLYALYVGWCGVEKREAVEETDFLRVLEVSQANLRRRDGLVFGIRLNETGKAMVERGKQRNVFMVLGVESDSEADFDSESVESRRVVLRNERGETLELREADWQRVERLARIAGFGLTLDVLRKDEAATFAAALESLLPDIPYNDCLKSTFRGPLRDPEEVTPLEWFSGPRKKKIEKLIEYSKHGAFAVQ